MKILYYIYQICIALPILLVLTILTAIVTIIGSLLGGAHFWGYYPGKIWSQLICLFLLIPVKIHGREKLHGKTSYIFVPNHQGSFDIFLIYGFIGRNFKWMMKKSLRKLPFVGKACESAGHIFVDRSGPKKVLETIRQAKDSLKDGVSLVVFPEGARTFTGHMGYFKKGAFQLADDLQLAVVPVTIDGSFEILPRTGKWIHRHRMILTIHDPIPPKGKGMENIKATMAEAYAYPRIPNQSLCINLLNQKVYILCRNLIVWLDIICNSWNVKVNPLFISSSNRSREKYSSFIPLILPLK